MSFPETKQNRRLRMTVNRHKRPTGASRPHNNRKGQPLKKQRQEMRDAAYLRARMNTNNSGTRVCRPYRIVAREQDRRWRKSSR